MNQRNAAFIEKMIALSSLPGVSAKIRKGDNPNTSYQSWEYLNPWCDITKEWMRLPFETIGAAVARAKLTKDGDLRFGNALADCYKGVDPGDSPAVGRLRRLLSCRNTIEACQIVKPMISLIQSRGIALCYADLLDDLQMIGGPMDDYVKAKIAREYYGGANDSL